LQKNIKGEPKKRGRPATRKAQGTTSNGCAFAWPATKSFFSHPWAAGAGRGRTKKAKRASEEEEEAEPKEVEVEKEKERMDQERAEGGPKEGGEEKEEPKEAAGEEMKTKEGEEETGKEEQASRFLEKGLIYFFYRPKVGLEEVHSLEEVCCPPSFFFMSIGLLSSFFLLVALLALILFKIPTICVGPTALHAAHPEGDDEEGGPRAP
jgi:hypothetical protein